MVVLAVAAVAGFGVWSRHRRDAPLAAEVLPYQARVSELSSAEQQRFEAVLRALRTAEQGRVSAGSWPEAFDTGAGIVWTRRAGQLYVNYLGVPEDPARPRWLVLIIEPAPSAVKDPAPPEDDEHHTLSDGTPIHVGVWTAPNQGPVPDVVLPFPAAEGWTQRIRGR